MLWNLANLVEIVAQNPINNEYLCDLCNLSQLVMTLKEAADHFVLRSHGGSTNHWIFKQ